MRASTAHGRCIATGHTPTQLDGPGDSADAGVLRTKQLTAASPARFDRYLLLPPLVAAVLFASGNDAFGFDPPGYLDSFVYVGYFWHYPEHLPLFENYYKISRLPWVLPGFVAHRLLGAMAGSYALHWATLSASAIALYLLVRDGFRDRTAGALLAVAWVCLVGGQGIGGWNYHMQAASAYHFIAFWAAVRAGWREGRPFYALIAGAALACAVHTNLLAVLFTPLIALTYAGTSPGLSAVTWRRVIRDVAASIAGAIGITLLLGAINAGTGGTWLFFMPQIEYSRWIARNDPFYSLASMWLPNALYLVIPIVALSVSTASLFRRVEPSRRFSVAIVVQAWLALAIFSVCQFGRRQSVLDHDYIAFGLYNYAFPALAVVLQRRDGALERRSSETFLTLGAAACIAIMWLYGRPNGLLQRLGDLVPTLGSGIPVMVPLVAGLTGLVVVALVPRRGAILAFAAWFTLLNAWVSSEYYGANRPGIRRNMLTVYSRLDTFTTALDPSLGGIKYWFEKETIETPQGPADLGWVFDSFVATRGWGGNLLSQGAPLTLDQLRPEHLQIASCVGVLSSQSAHDRVLARFVHAYEQQGQMMRRIRDATFSANHLAVAITILKPVAKNAAAPADGRKPDCLP